MRCIVVHAGAAVWLRNKFLFASIGELVRDLRRRCKWRASRHLPMLDGGTLLHADERRAELFQIILTLCRCGRREDTASTLVKALRLHGRPIKAMNLLEPFSHIVT